MPTTPSPSTPAHLEPADLRPTHHERAPARHTVRMRTSDGTTLTLHLPDECALTLEVDGREYVGVLMPTETAEEVRPVAVVTFDADGEGSTLEPVGYLAARPSARTEALPCRAWGCDCPGDGVVDTP